jgi:hypothetical protein
VRSDSDDALKQAVDVAYPRSYPQYCDKYAIHICKIVEGVRVYDNLLKVDDQNCKYVS